MYKLFKNKPAFSQYSSPDTFAPDIPVYDEIGRSMIEMLGVLALIAILSVGGIAGYNKAVTKFKVNKTIHQIAVIAQNVRTVFANEKNYKELGYYGYEALSVQNLSDIGVITSDMISKECVFDEGGHCSYIVNPFNGAVFINHDELVLYDNINHKAFVISSGGLKKEECLELAIKDWNALGVSGLALNAGDDTSDLSYIVSDDEYLDTYGTLLASPKGKNIGIPIPPNIAAKACSHCDEYETGCSIQIGFFDD